MGTRRRFLYRSTFLLAILSTGFLMFNMVAMRVFAEEIFRQRYILSPAEVLIALGFCLIVAFNGFSFLWILLRNRESRDICLADMGMLFLGAFCFLLLIGAKVMVDEIAHEYRFGWEVVGEWVILYTLLTIQLIYNLLLLRTLLRIRREGHTGCTCGPK